MQIILSPAKTLDFETPSRFTDHTIPSFLDDSCVLIDRLKTMTPEELSKLMKISEKLGTLNYERNQQWQVPFTITNSKQCIYAFQGDVYTGLEADKLSKRDITFAQKQLKILSGLYGLLKPLDLIQPYRLEMGTRFNNERGKDLYQFWGDKLTQVLNEELNGRSALINLASNEYSKVLQMKNIDAEVIAPVFKDKKNGAYKLISFYAKKARGMMARYIIINRIKHPKDLKDFDLGGYQYNESLSQNNNWVFTRDNPPVAGN